ncbi:hypothetical protein HV299_04800 [Klebsiella grimontii]|uniref:hypothetical protein n=1 Tax=Klebsiella TaxID=570 RepID=UPI0012B9D8C1|nr:MULTISPECIES: hypothetical protein [Klebsiella]MBZ7128776.1 hypothetical protein [Klebsiella grimontii]MBZ7341513.1 hypothetical protein [Klebsiella grimontii]MCB3529037.1 hypothetical protein [Klebsiella grimontii]MDR4267805.1 hypothetical protein [Klebsiella grimontii]QLT07733.1 hypothetical protein HV299_04800 [Klebsiella grimontii]
MTIYISAIDIFNSLPGELFSGFHCSLSVPAEQRASLPEKYRTDDESSSLWWWGAVAPRLRHEVLPSQQAAGMVVATTMISMITLNTIIGTLAGRPMRHRALSNAGII